VLLVGCVFSCAQYLSQLNKFAHTYNLAVFITNQVTADPGAAAMFSADRASRACSSRAAVEPDHRGLVCWFGSQKAYR
jgi:hypothetical protein